MKNMAKRFIFFNVLVISAIMLVLVIHVRLSERSTLSAGKTVLTVVICIGLVFLGSWLLSKIALAPIKAAWQKQLDFTADASHELRTPLSIIQTNLDVVLSNPQATVESQMKWLKNIEIENKRMSALVADLLLLSRADTDEAILHLENFDLSALAAEIALTYKPITARYDLTLSSTITENIIIRGDKDRIKQLLLILIDNAVKYTPPNGNIDIVLAHNETNAAIEIADNGIGMAPEEVLRVFDRFYRGKLSRQRNPDGSGLGLSIAKLISEAHGGKITVASQSGKGAVFTVNLPIYTPNTPA